MRKPSIQSQDARVRYVQGPVITGGMGIFAALMPHLPPAQNYRGSGQYAGFFNLYQAPSVALQAVFPSPQAGIPVEGQLAIDGLYSSLPSPQLETPSNSIPGMA
ncbi:MAG: hypothetical protein ACP5EP_12290 [Acidobacteriaceae bacterium]